MTDVKFPDVTVQLTGGYGNVFGIIGQVTFALKRADVSMKQIQEFKKEAMSGDYDHAVQTCMRWVNVE
jgi:hypothetical protein